ncbi:alanine/glycine:cation symporter family protein [Alkaliphilus oremlandii]|uniref:Amino acid carrier protein n=1 Tax=Alkaliphilus oremlandii (strain OhILAs) TaxID=350688 RepID=A8MHJ5_ALKOO|nr:sodium:alanine symporter family protein [Alkaliphilus oremlandii]ABW19277.1 amino acid carrier protein [Alkaliphilus oremlandii OhILAs]
MFALLNTIGEINGIINDFVWGPYMLVLVVGTGLLFTFRSGFFQIRKFGYTMKNTVVKMFDKTEVGENEITPFQAVSTALAATVGTGNIAGVATAISLGGPGALFWMWFAAFFGMMTKFAEVVLAIQYREKNAEGAWVGGPMYYIKNGLNMKWLATVFAALTAIAGFGIGNMTQSNSIASALSDTFSVPPMVTGALLAVATGLIIFGGLKRIASVTEMLVPFMAAFYIVGGLVVVLANASQIPAAFAEIFSSAFSGRAAVGGFAGSTVMAAMRFGVARGVFTNEAGLGSAPIAHATAKTDHPVQQGLWGVFEVFIDTIVIASITGLAILTTGVWQGGATGASLTIAAFNSVIPFGGAIVAIGILLFAFSTILGWSFYGEKAMEYLFGLGAVKFYRMLWVPLVFIGCISSLDLVWGIADTLNGLMMIPNLVGLLALSGVVIKLTKEYFSGKATSK